ECGEKKKKNTTCTLLEYKNKLFLDSFNLLVHLSFFFGLN
ncbi:hypothetical protein, partial [Plasmodium yoelii yoelii]